MDTTSRNRTKRIATRKVADGYRVTGQRKTYHSFSGAFNAACRVASSSPIHSGQHSANHRLQ